MFQRRVTGAADRLFIRRVCRYTLMTLETLNKAPRANGEMSSHQKTQRSVRLLSWGWSPFSKVRMFMDASVIRYRLAASPRNFALILAYPLLYSLS